MDRAIGSSSTYYLANYTQPSYATSYVTNFSASYVIGDIHNSATHLHNDYIRVSENSKGVHVPSSNIVACGTPLHNSRISVPPKSHCRNILRHIRGEHRKSGMIYIRNLVKILQKSFLKLELCKLTSRKRLTRPV
jgi:hypothetical protein